MCKRIVNIQLYVAWRYQITLIEEVHSVLFHKICNISIFQHNIIISLKLLSKNICDLRLLQNIFGKVKNFNTVFAYFLTASVKVYIFGGENGH